MRETYMKRRCMIDLGQFHIGSPVSCKSSGGNNKFRLRIMFLLVCTFWDFKFSKNLVILIDHFQPS